MAIIKALSNLVCILVILKTVECSISNGLTKYLNEVESDPDLENYIKNVLQNFRELMTEGIPEINLPVLDPLNYQNLDINIDQKTSKINLYINQVTVRDLSTFQLQQLTANLEEYFLKLKLTIPVVSAVGECRLNGKLMMIFPLSSNGSFSVNVTNAEISGLAQLKIIDQTFQFSKLDLDLSWKELQFFLENFLGGKAVLSMAQRMIPNIVKSFIENYKIDILNKLNALLKKFPISGDRIPQLMTSLNV